MDNEKKVHNYTPNNIQKDAIDASNDIITGSNTLIDLEGQSVRKLPHDFIGKIGDGHCSIIPPQTLNVDSKIEEIFYIARQKHASDVHISVENPIYFKIYSILHPVTKDKLTEHNVQRLIKSILTPEQLLIFETTGDIELIYVLDGLGRFRVTISKKTPGIDFTIRLIPLKLYSFEESQMPESCLSLIEWAQGLVLVTGPIGCGKTTTLAVLCEIINQTRKEHIITMESPIEIVYTPKLSQITQREINLHTLSQDNALRAALRQDPDILIISELRDLSTIQLAATAAETGHLVLGTMNTNDAAQTILRIVNSFPPEDRSLIQNMISESLRGIICEQLIPKKDGSGLVPAYEVLIVNSAVSNLIRKGSLDQIMRVVATGKTEGMITFDLSLRLLLQQQLISWDEAYNRCVNKKEFEKYRYNFV